jgi:dCMP deaminase
MAKHDDFYMAVADSIELGANCSGTNVGAVVVLEDRIVSTGYNGTPAGFKNCKDYGCIRCSDSELNKAGRSEEMVSQRHKSGDALDRCICVHAEQNAFLTAAKFGIGLNGAELFTTSSPCFNCLKEACQIGITRVVYKKWYPLALEHELEQLYVRLYGHMSKGIRENFEMIGGARPPFETPLGVTQDAAK